MALSLEEVHRSSTRFLASSQSPLLIQRGNTRDVTEGLRYQAASAGDRLEVAAQISTALVLSKLERLKAERRLDEVSESDSDELWKDDSSSWSSSSWSDDSISRLISLPVLFLVDLAAAAAAAGGSGTAAGEAAVGGAAIVPLVENANQP